MTVSAAAPWVVHKFGGSSVADAACFRQVADILEAQPTRRLGVVLSACKGVTDSLLRLVALAEARDEAYQTQLSQLRDRHAQIAETLLPPAESAAWLAEFDRDRTDLSGILQTTSLLRSAAQNVRDLVAGYGEIWSTSLFARYLRHRRGGSGEPVHWLDARKVVGSA
jgi:aspartokinase/homoserine dehydrogenase 1